MTNRLARALHRRYLDVVGSIYIYNEHRGYTSIDRVLEAVRELCPEDVVFIAAIEKHRADERKHYIMFRRWFELRGVMPLAVDRACGHIDRFVEILFRSTIDDLDTKAVLGSEALFERLCRVIMLTERRGMRQVDTLLQSRLIRSDPVLTKIFKIVQRDEPSHWQPYEAWLLRTNRPQARLSERIADFWIHRELLFIKLPWLFINIWSPRRYAWADDTKAVEQK
ncbi:MAG: hypothetical protein JWL66_1184 [Sphingomonadales bacterium]|nr:hypothetical protein [Sphingomonadales bacterium]